MARKKKEASTVKLELPKKAYIFWVDAWASGEPYLRCVDDMRDTKGAIGSIGEYCLLAEGETLSTFVPKKD